MHLVSTIGWEAKGAVPFYFRKESCEVYTPSENNPHPLGGIQRIFKFANGYGASVVCNFGTYGGKEGKFELAVLNKNGCLTYDTPITSDVIGYLTEEEVQTILKQIDELTDEIVEKHMAEKAAEDQEEASAKPVGEDCHHGSQHGSYIRCPYCDPE